MRKRKQWEAWTALWTGLRAALRVLPWAVREQMTAADGSYMPAMREPEAAEEFVKFLFTAETQKISHGGGLPVQKEVFRDAIQKVNLYLAE